MEFSYYVTILPSPSLSATAAPATLRVIVDAFLVAVS